MISSLKTKTNISHIKKEHLSKDLTWNFSIWTAFSPDTYITRSHGGIKESSEAGAFLKKRSEINYQRLSQFHLVFIFFTLNNRNFLKL